VKYKDLTLTTRLKQIDFKKGTFIWMGDLEDFETIRTIGQKSPTKRDKWMIELQTNDLNVVGECDYDTARIIHLIQDAFFDYKREVLGKMLQLKESIENNDYKHPEYLIKDVVKDLDLENL